MCECVKSVCEGVSVRVCVCPCVYVYVYVSECACVCTYMCYNKVLSRHDHVLQVCLAQHPIHGCSIQSHLPRGAHGIRLLFRLGMRPSS